jgi:hypothetical protein
MIKLTNLTEFFIVHNISINNIQYTDIQLTIQITFLLFNIGLWYLHNKTRNFILYTELYNYDFKDEYLNFYNIPNELYNKYITIINPLVYEINTNKEACFNSINHLNTYNISYNALYVQNMSYKYIIFIYKPIISSKIKHDILIINLKDLSVYRDTSLHNTIEQLSMLLDNIFSYQFLKISNNNLWYHNILS